MTTWLLYCFYLVSTILRPSPCKMKSGSTWGFPLVNTLRWAVHSLFSKPDVHLRSQTMFVPLSLYPFPLLNVKGTNDPILPMSWSSYWPISPFDIPRVASWWMSWWNSLILTSKSLGLFWLMLFRYFKPVKPAIWELELYIGRHVFHKSIDFTSNHQHFTFRPFSYSS